MKKLLLVLAIGAFVACSDSTTETESTADTAAVSAPADTATLAPAPVDTAAAAHVDSTMKSDSAK